MRWILEFMSDVGWIWAGSHRPGFDDTSYFKEVSTVPVYWLRHVPKIGLFVVASVEFLRVLTDAVIEAKKRCNYAGILNLSVLQYII